MRAASPPVHGPSLKRVSGSLLCSSLGFLGPLQVTPALPMPKGRNRLSTTHPAAGRERKERRERG